MIDWGWVIDNRAMIGDLLWQHARMVLLALLFGSLLTGGLLAITLRWPATAQPLITLCGVLFTIPSLALFILLLPFTGLSLTTSLIGLTLYSLLILLRNVLAGMEKLPQAALESARALGYTRDSASSISSCGCCCPPVCRAAHCLGDAGRPGHRHRADRPGRAGAAAAGGF
jgi:osmoprotectant transport system permease protein